ncbi:knob-associated histidine-rich protein-like [Branchiostoma lanceolatum]|uniref:knob-associated histidine-rich protein-like n=1 Tax=Branchiostoma lanceolatum TaxID=7740 RepID=UPI00345589A7
MLADDPSELSPTMTVTDMLQAVVTEDDYKKWRKENGIGEKKKKKKKMPRKGLDELKSERSDDSETGGRMSWADIIELGERDSQSDDSADQEILVSETRRSISPDRVNVDRRKQTAPRATEAVTVAKAVNGSCQHDTGSEDSRTKKSTKTDDTLSERDTARKTSESEVPSSTKHPPTDGVDNVHTPAIGRSQEETIKKSESFTRGAEIGTSDAGDSNSEVTQNVTTIEDCQRKGTRKSGQHRLRAEQHRTLQELRRRFSSIPPLTWQRLRAVLENHPVMLDMEHEQTLTFFSQQPPRVMSKAVDNLRKDCYQKMRNPWNFLQALTEAAAREYISQAVYSSAV